VRNIYGQPIYLKDIAQIIDTVKDKESYSRLNNKNVVTLQIVKRAGENLIITTDKIKAQVAEMRKMANCLLNLMWCLQVTKVFRPEPHSMNSSIPW
jgi:multidrug efflux pump subunit AcrB